MLQIKKVISLPDPLLPNTIYLVEDGTADGLKIVVTGIEGSVIRSTSSKAEVLQVLQTYVDDRIDEVIAQIPVVWTTTAYDHGETWGSIIFLKQVSGVNWRIRKIDAAGAVTHSYKAAPSNSGYTVDTAWTDRASLIYS